MPSDPRCGVGAAAIVVELGQVLMVHRQGSHGSDSWSFPGGWQDYGETPDRTAERELEEETGLEVFGPRPRMLDVIHTDFKDEGFSCTTWFYKIYNWRGEPRNLEPTKCKEVAWIPLAQVLTLPLFKPAEQFCLKRFG
jgi:mutator protein MutT